MGILGNFCYSQPLWLIFPFSMSTDFVTLQKRGFSEIGNQNQYDSHRQATKYYPDHIKIYCEANDMKRNREPKKKTSRLELLPFLSFSISLSLYPSLSFFLSSVFLYTRAVCLRSRYIERILIVIRAKISKILKPQHTHTTTTKTTRSEKKSAQSVKSNGKTA